MIRRMKRGQWVTSVAAVAALLLPVSLPGQIRSITAAGEYAFPLSRQADVRSATAFGGEAVLDVAVGGDILLGLSIGYSSYAIDQENALGAWDWNFWNDRYYPKIQSDMRADPNLSVQLSTVQHLNAIPVMLSAAVLLAAGEDVTIIPRVGGGMSFFTRRLYVEEVWTKQFPGAGYTLTYDLRNFAPDKVGNTFIGAVGCDLEVRLFSDVSLVAAVRYRTTLTASSGARLVPFRDECSTKLGMTFLY